MSAGKLAKPVSLFVLSKSGMLVDWAKRAVIAHVYEGSPALAESLQTKEQEKLLWDHVVK